MIAILGRLSYGVFGGQKMSEDSEDKEGLEFERLEKNLRTLRNPEI